MLSNAVVQLRAMTNLEFLEETALIVLLHLRTHASGNGWTEWTAACGLSYSRTIY